MIPCTMLNMFEFAAKYCSHFDKKYLAGNQTQVSQLLAWRSNWLSYCSYYIDMKRENLIFKKQEQYLAANSNMLSFVHGIIYQKTS